jgi:HNH endonuclease
VEERTALERKLYELPRLREAMRERRICYEKARLIARHAEEGAVDASIERAEHIPCITLRRELQANEETRMCARGEFEVWAPRRVASVIALACSAARRAAGRWISTGECLATIAEHFIAVWEPALAARPTPHRRVLERDRFLCQVPGCSRAADHAHHIDYRSRGGSDDPSNLVSLCAVHHLQGIHMGRIRVFGAAPDRLCWQVATGEGWATLG